MVWYPRLAMPSSRFVYKFLFLLLHYCPAIVADIVLKYKESKLSLVKIYNKAYFHLDQYTYFFSHEWKFSHTNVNRIWTSMSEKDHVDFPCKATEEEWEQYISNGCFGARKYILEDPYETLPKARQKYTTLKALHYILSASIYGIILYYLSKFFFLN